MQQQRRQVAFLHVLDKETGDPVYRFTIYEGTTQIGFHPTSDVPLRYAGVAAEHAKIEIEGGLHFLENLREEKITKIDDFTLKRTGHSYQISNNQILTFGEVRCLYEITDGSNSTHTSPEFRDFSMTKFINPLLTEITPPTQLMLSPTQPISLTALAATQATAYSNVGTPGRSLVVRAETPGGIGMATPARERAEGRPLSPLTSTTSPVLPPEHSTVRDDIRSSPPRPTQIYANLFKSSSPKSSPSSPQPASLRTERIKYYERIRGAGIEEESDGELIHETPEVLTAQMHATQPTQPMVAAKHEKGEGREGEGEQEEEEDGREREMERMYHSPGGLSDMGRAEDLDRRHVLVPGTEKILRHVMRSPHGAHESRYPQSPLGALRAAKASMVSLGGGKEDEEEEGLKDERDVIHLALTTTHSAEKHEAMEDFEGVPASPLPEGDEDTKEAFKTGEGEEETIKGTQVPRSSVGSSPEPEARSSRIGSVAASVSGEENIASSQTQQDVSQEPIRPTRFTRRRQIMDDDDDDRGSVGGSSRNSQQDPAAVKGSSPKQSQPEHAVVEATRIEDIFMARAEQSEEREIEKSLEKDEGNNGDAQGQPKEIEGRGFRSKRVAALFSVKRADSERKRTQTIRKQPLRRSKSLVPTEKPNASSEPSTPSRSLRKPQGAGEKKGAHAHRPPALSTAYPSTRRKTVAQAKAAGPASQPKAGAIKGNERSSRRAGQYEYVEIVNEPTTPTRKSARTLRSTRVSSFLSAASDTAVARSSATTSKQVSFSCDLEEELFGDNSDDLQDVGSPSQRSQVSQSTLESSSPPQPGDRHGLTESQASELQEGEVSQTLSGRSSGKRKRERASSRAATSSLPGTPRIKRSARLIRAKESLTSPRRTRARSTTPAPALEGDAPVVLFTGIDEGDIQKRRRTVEDLGGSVTHHWQDCTHVVTDKVRRTLKFICALANGKKFVSTSWIDASRRQRRFVSEEGYLIRDTVAERRYDFSLRESLAVTSDPTKPKLMAGLRAYPTANIEPSQAEMREILSAAGAEALEFLPSQPAPELLIVGGERDADLCRRLQEEGYEVVDKEFVLSGVLRQELDRVKYRYGVVTSPPTQPRSPSKKRRR
ncbi:uncharacterized protein VTP21DRAFT_2480 [Calcarisporiella thermophila]|uniref:uncharacterized protein n=1 Tax=Calcarisporiella thermophila TaxID=911321 RepID=UPI003742985C